VTTHLYTPRGDLMSRVLEVEHRPEIGIGVRLGDLVQWCVVLVDNFVDWRDDAGVFYRPSQVARGLAPHDIGRFGTFGDRREG
jgi:hypothetical protein